MRHWRHDIRSRIGGPMLFDQGTLTDVIGIAMLSVELLY
jgi:hypothetical protein